MTDVDAALTAQIHRLSEMDVEELRSLSQSIERAYVHVMIEQALRDGVSP